MTNGDIIKILDEIEEKEDIDIIYACESGSRVWGFANEDSDYDIRFIYKRRDIKDYLSLKNSKDVIEWQWGDYDIVGWDIRKALNLHYKNNPNLREWLNCDEVYIDRGIDSVFSGLQGFDISVLKNHYMAMAKVHWKKYSGLEFKKEKTKKYLYVIRSILCWKLLNRDIFPPISIEDLINHDYINIKDSEKDAIHELISYHKGECDLSENSFLKLNNFIMDSFSRMKTSKRGLHKDFSQYDERFRELLLHV